MEERKVNHISFIKRLPSKRVACDHEIRMLYKIREILYLNCFKKPGTNMYNLLDYGKISEHRL